MMNQDINQITAQFELLDRVPVGLCLLRADFVVLYWNRLLEDWTKIPRAEIVGTDIRDRFPHLQEPKYRVRLKQVFKGGFPAVFSAQLHQALIPSLQANGQPRIQQMVVTAVPEISGDGFYGLLSIQDVTELTEQINNYRAEIRERKRTEAELQRSNEELERFAYIASHDLQEPLRMVTSFTKLLSQRYSGQLDASADQIINFAVDGATRMQALINDLLMYSRVGTRKKPLEPVDCEALLQQVLANFQLLIEETGATIIKSSLPVIVGDKAQLLQLFQNLVNNAIKYRSDRSPQVEIGAELHNGQWLFWVKDNGIGIDPTHNERIFLIFQRLHTREKYAGTGIGLALCKRIVERHEGRIWVESEEGKGAKFYFTLPQLPE